MLPGKCQSLSEGDAAVASPCQCDPIATGSRQRMLQLLSGRQGYGLLLGAGDADGAGIAATMAGVDDDEWPISRYPSRFDDALSARNAMCLFRRRARLPCMLRRRGCMMRARRANLMTCDVLGSCETGWREQDWPEHHHQRQATTDHTCRGKTSPPIPKPVHSVSPCRPHGKYQGSPVALTRITLHRAVTHTFVSKLPTVASIKQRAHRTLIGNPLHRRRHQRRDGDLPDVRRQPHGLGCQDRIGGDHALDWR